MAVYAGPNIIKDGLVLHLDAANFESYPGSGTLWADLSIQANHGTLTNGSTYSGANGGSITFDGTNDLASFGNVPLSNTNKITIDFWCKVLYYPEVNGGGVIVMELSTNYNVATEGLFIGIGDDSAPSFNGTFPISLNIRGNTGYNIHGYDKSSVNDLKWHNWCCIFDKSVSGTNPIESKLFIDSVEKTVTTFVDSSLRTDNTNNFGNQPLYIGSRSGGVAPSNIQIGSVKIYNRVLSATEIQQNFNAIRGRYGL